MRGRRESWPRRCGTTPSSARASIRSSRFSSEASPSSKTRSAWGPSGSAGFPARSTSSLRYTLSNDPRVRKDVELVAALRRELRDDRAFVAGTKPVQRVGRDRALVTRPQHELPVPVDVQLAAAPAAAKRLLLAGPAVAGRVTVLRANLPGEEERK